MSLLWFMLVPALAAADTITNITVAPSDNTAGNRATYTVTFRAPLGLAATDKIVITFPSGFNIAGVIVAAPQAASFTGGLVPSASGQILTLTRDGTGNNVADVPVTISFSLVTNHLSPGNYRLSIQTKSGSDVLKDSDNGTAPLFSLVSNHDPYGTFVLIPTTTKLPADGIAKATITSQAITDLQGSPVGFGKLLTVTVNDTSLGKVEAASDASTTLPGLQVATDNASKISFQFKAGRNGGTATILVTGGSNGAASGSLALSVNQLRILSIQAGRDTVSTGQTGIPATMVLQNVGRDAVTFSSASLNFIGSGADIGATRISPDPGTPIPGNFQTVQVSFSLSVASKDKVNGKYLIDGAAAATVLVPNDISDNKADQIDSIFVQKAPQLSYFSGTLSPRNASVGSSYQFRLRVHNTGNAALQLNPEATYLQLLATGHSPYLAKLDANGVRTVTQGDTTITFRSTSIPADFPQGAYQPNVVFSGTHNGTPFFVDTLAVEPVQVGEGEPFEIVSVTPSQETVTQNMGKLWFIEVVVRNNNDFDLTFFNATLQFAVGGQSDNGYVVQEPTAFSDGFTTLGARSTKSLSFKITRTGGLVGSASIFASVKTTDDVNAFYEANSGGIQGGFVVQSPAALTASLAPSQPFVNQNQTQDWLVAMSLTNTGGSDVEVLFTDSPPYISLQDSLDFTVLADTVLSGLPPKKIVAGGKTRVVNFVVDKTGQRRGVKRLAGIVDVMEVNSGRLFSTTARDSSVTVQTAARVGVSKTDLAQVFNPDSVNTGQQFQVKVGIRKQGEEALEAAWVRLESDGASTILDHVVAVAGDSAVFNVNAGNTRNLSGETFTASLDSSVAANTKARALPLAAQDNTARAIIDAPADLSLLSVTTSLRQDSVAALQTADWKIFVALRAAENATAVVLDSVPDLSLTVSGAPAPDYVVKKPSGFAQRGGLRLPGGASDTLTYVVDRTGYQGGQLQITANIAGRDANDRRVLLVSGNKAIQVLNQTVVSIVSVGFADKGNTNGVVGFVNTNQEFLIKVRVQNLGFEDVDWAAVSLEKTTFGGGSEIIAARDTIRNIPNQQEGVGIFTVRASSLPTLNGELEIFKVHIDSVRTPTTVARIGQPINNDSVKVQVQAPARLEIQAETSAPDNQLTVGQNFEIRVRVLNRGEAPYGNGGQVRITTVPAGYTVVNNVAKSINEGSTAVWQATAPSQPGATATFRITMAPVPADRNSGTTAQVIGSNPADLPVKVNASALAVRSVFIAEPEGAQDHVVSTEQTFVLAAKLTRSPNVSEANAKLELVEGYRLAEGEVAEKTVVGDSAAWVVRAPSSADGEVALNVLVSGKDSGGQALPSSSLSTLVQAVSRASLTLLPGISEPPGAANGKLAFGQSFKISAKLSNGGAAKTYGAAMIRFDPGESGVTVAEGEPLEQTLVFPPDSYSGEAIWNALAPDTLSVQKQLHFTVLQLPKDENTDGEASILLRTVNFEVSTDDHGAMAVSQMQVFEPEGARDSTLSTEQVFTLSANVAYLRAGKVTARLVLPAGGFVPEPLNADLEVPLAGTADNKTVFWQVKAPAQAFARAVFRVEVRGTDASNPDFALDPVADSLALKFVRRADFVYSGEVTNPAAARDRVVSAGQSFEVTAILDNLGEAQTAGPDSILLVLPVGYTLDRRVDTTLVKSSTATGSQRHASWWVIAPNRKSSTPTGEVFKLQLQKLVNDENTNQAARFNTFLAQFNVVVEERQLVVDLVNANRHPPVARGQDSLAVLDLELQNTGAGDNSNKILLKELRVYVKDQHGNRIAPGMLLSALRLVDATNPAQVYGSLAFSPLSRENPVLLPLTSPVAVSFNAPRLVTLLASLTDTDSVTAFSFGFEHSADIVARDEDSDSLVAVVDATGRTGANFKVTSSLAVLVEASLNNFFNYPNPMRVGLLSDAGTQFVYFLSRDSNVELEIYTMLGELVWLVKYQATDPEGRQGNHGARGGGLDLPGISWDGFNGNRQRVLNGVYLAVLKTNSGTVHTKVAVIK